MPKTVQEIPFKLFLTLDDARSNSNFIMENVDVEGGSPPEQIWSKSLSAFFLIKRFPRQVEGDRVLEIIYLKID